MYAYVCVINMLQSSLASENVLFLLLIRYDTPSNDHDLGDFNKHRETLLSNIENLPISHGLWILISAAPNVQK